MHYLTGYTICCMYNITLCTMTELTAHRSHTSNTVGFQHPATPPTEGMSQTLQDDLSSVSLQP